MLTVVFKSHVRLKGSNWNEMATILLKEVISYSSKCSYFHTFLIGLI